METPGKSKKKWQEVKDSVKELQNSFEGFIIRMDIAEKESEFEDI